jgi:heme-degrading monooxygenase HmoA
MPTPITAFEVPPGADSAFLAAWRGGDALLYRALRADVRFRYVAVGAAPAGEFHARAGRYEIVREHATPDVAGGAVLIEPYEVAPEDDDRFLAGWDAVRAAHAEQQGYLGARLHRAVEPADLRFVEIARWSSPLMLARARQRPAFQAAALGFKSHPALYQVVQIDA